MSVEDLIGLSQNLIFYVLLGAFGFMGSVVIHGMVKHRKQAK
jgi:hypothetical protein